MDSRIDYNQRYITNLSIIDEEFVDKVQHDIARFVLRRPNQSVLLFPPVNNFRRFLIHQTCVNFSQKYDICTFSVGQGSNRRTVVTFKSQLLQTQKFNEETIECKKGTNLKNNLKTVKNMGVKRQTTDVRLNKTNEINLYRPPALRNNLQTSNNNDLINMNENKTSVNPTTPIATKSGILHTTLKVAPTNLLPTKNQTQNGDTKNNSITLMANMKKCKLQQQQQFDYNHTTTTSTNTCPSETLNETNESMKQEQQQQQHQQVTVRRERRPDRAVYIPRARRSQTTPPTAASGTLTTTTTTATTTVDNVSNDVNLLSPITVGKVQLQKSSRNSNGNRNDIKTTTTATTPLSSQKKIHVQMLSEQQQQQQQEEKILLNEVQEEESEKEKELLNLINQPIKNDCDNEKSVQQQQQQQENIKDLFNNELETIKCNNIVTKQTDVDEKFMNINGKEKQNNKDNHINNQMNNNNKKCHEIVNENIEEQELKRASKEMNRSNRRIIKQTFVSAVLEIPDQLPNTENILINNHHIETHQEQSLKLAMNNFKKETNEVTTDEDDWDTMYDESGICLDSKITEEITNAVGKVKLDLPEMDYSMYLSKQKLLEKESFPHVLEVSNFPAEFKHQDLLMVFSQYKESGFDIKWVDDTHALAVFSSARIAAEVLTMGHPFVVLKILSDATPESRAKAKKCATSLQPYRPRPETCAALARRLVTGALGVRLKTAAAEREKEKRVLKEAKERKLMAAKQRDETWDN